jgi:hypothetical protein
VTPIGQFKNYKEINIGKYDFKNPPAENREEPKLTLDLRTPLRNQNEHSKSVTGRLNDRIDLNSKRSPFVGINSDYVIDDRSVNFNSNLGGDLLHTDRSPSQCTMVPQIVYNLQKNHEIPASQQTEIDDATEFTEQQDLGS